MVQFKDSGYYCLDDMLDLGGNPKLALIQGILSSLSGFVVKDLIDNFSPEIIEKVICEVTRLDSENVKAAIIDENLNEPNEISYLKKVEGYNFWEQALGIGAILGNASDEVLRDVQKVGKSIGMGYIIANDTWDFGKDLEDFPNGKYTLPNVWLFDSVNSEQERFLSDVFGKKNLSCEVKDYVRKIAVENGVVDKGKKLAMDFCQEGIDLLERKFKDSKVRQYLIFSTTTTQRNKFYDSLKRFE